MASLNRVSGTELGDLDDIRQSIFDIITTPVGTRVMRRDYGSHVFDTIDAPGSDLGALRVIAAAADGIARWERRVRLKSAHVLVSLDGGAILRTVSVVKVSGLTITADARLSGGA